MAPVCQMCFSVLVFILRFFVCFWRESGIFIICVRDVGTQVCNNLKKNLSVILLVKWVYSGITENCNLGPAGLQASPESKGERGFYRGKGGRMGWGGPVINKKVHWRKLGV